MSSLLNLGRGISPKYDEWDALLYLTWYQPRQVNLALALAWPFREQPQPLHIIDLGCGSMAMAMAIAIAVAESELSEEDVHIELHGIDPSEAMTAIGLRLWRTFSSIVRSRPRIRMACERTQEWMGTWRSLEKYYESGRAHKGWIYPSPNCWLLAVHAIYASNWSDLQSAFRLIRKRSDPCYEVVTCHTVGYEEARLVGRSDARERRLLKQSFYFSGDLCRTTSWRRQLADRLFPAGISRTRTSVPVRKLLYRPVPWSTPQQDDRCIMWYYSWEPT